VNVNLGATDVDSPTASRPAAPSTTAPSFPGRELGARVAGSIGEYDYSRFFGMLDTAI
jgi:iron complex outermembrane receptor protein